MDTNAEAITTLTSFQTDLNNQSSGIAAQLAAVALALEILQNGYQSDQAANESAIAAGIAAASAQAVATFAATITAILADGTGAAIQITEIQAVIEALPAQS